MARAAIPKTKAAELFDDFIKRVESHEAIDEFTLERFSRDALKDIGRTPEDANVLAGVIAAYRFDIPNVHKYHQAAIRVAQSMFAIGNYAVSLSMVGLLGESLEQAILATELWPEDIGALRIAITTAAQIGALDKVKELCAVYSKRTGEELDLVEPCRNMQSIFEKYEISQADYQRGISLAKNILVNRKIHQVDAGSEVDMAQGEESLLYTIRLPLELKDVLVLQDELALVLADTFGDRWRPEVLMYEYQAMS